MSGDIIFYRRGRGGRRVFFIEATDYAFEKPGRMEGWKNGKVEGWVMASFGRILNAFGGKFFSLEDTRR